MRRKGIEIPEANLCPDHIHMLLKSPLIIFDRFARLKYKYGARKFWYRRYYVDMVDRNHKKISEHIRNQVKEDGQTDQLTRKELAGPLTGEPIKAGKKVK